ncbi:MAG TPA: sugar porter family MFS transporter [Candidatus Sulfotelmatobacter sp.]|nr:sugar porter family MFS transporter [Candidatus Sulfotelmatobacter sp.]
MKTPDTSQLPSSQTGAESSSRLNITVVYIALIAALGGLLFGFDTAVISGTTDWLKSHFALSDFWLGFTVSSALIGTIIGSIAIGRPADVLGRRSILFILAAFYCVSALGCAMAWDWWSFLAFRFLGGLAVGGASVASPMYIAEIAPARYRGRLVAFAQFNIVLGVLLAYLSNYIIVNLQLGESQYRWMFGVMAAPSVVFFLLLFFTPQSPRWLVARNRAAEARMVLEKCGTDAGGVDDEIREIQASLDVEHHALNEPFFCRKYLKPIMLAVAIAMFNQLSGINAILYYSAHIFEMAGSGTQSAMGQSVIIGFTNLVFTVAAMAVIDHFGRRRLMIAGSIGYIVSLVAAAYAFYTHTGGKLLLISLLVFIASHAFGQGAVIWVFISEIFPNRVRARGQALGTFTHWVMCAAISWTFPMIAAKSGGNTFAFYAVCMVGQLFWVLLLMPETKGISLERIQKHLGIE